MASLVDRALAGERRALARLVTAVEDDTPEGRRALAELWPRGGQAATTGFTGPPGSGKSTLVDGFVAALRARDTRVGIVAVDPSSPFTGGAVLGDRIRMLRHGDDPGVYLRSMANRGHLGGLAAATPRVLALLDGLGFPELVVETVGVGQAEVEVAAEVDTTVVVVTPGFGDAVQAAKAGLLEVADVLVVNKADLAGAETTVGDLVQMLDLGAPQAWRPPVVQTVAIAGDGIDDLLAAVEAHRRHLAETGEGERRRRRRVVADLHAAVHGRLEERLRATAPGAELVEAVVSRRLDPWTAADRILGGRPG